MNILSVICHVIMPGVSENWEFEFVHSSISDGWIC